MLGLLLIYFVGKKFYDLADNYNRSKWGFAILGILSYYVGLLAGAFCLGLALALAFDMMALDSTEELLVSLISIPIGILTCWGFYKLLESNWRKTSRQGFDQILDAGFTKDNERRL